jgi:2-C-methyl-D-erythritol 2,4-cyclodiphosphate synthase
MYRSGLGWDVHELEKGRGLYLGCVHFKDAPVGLKGHSDADVVAHALCDALLGAAALGDIGEHFPNTDAKYTNFPGSKFLEAVAKLVADAGYKIENVDCTVMSDAVRLEKKKGAMASAIAWHLGIDVERASVKATTWEGRGAVGRGEVIACQAIATVSKKGS